MPCPVYHKTIAGKRRKLPQTKAPEAMMTLLDTALSAGLKADYVFFDSWFSNPAQITAIHSKDMDVIAMQSVFLKCAKILFQRIIHLFSMP